MHTTTPTQLRHAPARMRMHMSTCTGTHPRIRIQKNTLIWNTFKGIHKPSPPPSPPFPLPRTQVCPQSLAQLHACARAHTRTHSRMYTHTHTHTPGACGCCWGSGWRLAAAKRSRPSAPSTLPTREDASAACRSVGMAGAGGLSNRGQPADFQSTCIAGKHMRAGGCKRMAQALHGGGGAGVLGSCKNHGFRSSWAKLTRALMCVVMRGGYVCHGCCTPSASSLL